MDYYKLLDFATDLGKIKKLIVVHKSLPYVYNLTSTV